MKNKANGEVAAIQASCPVCGDSHSGKWLQAPDRFHGRRQLYQLIRCNSCSLVWLDNPPTAEEMPYHYGTNYHKSITASGEANSFMKWKGPRDRVSQFARGGSLLDIGCSSGAFLKTMKSDSWKLYGIEISPDEARRAEINSDAQVFVGEVADAPYCPESFDVITAFHVLEHVYRPSKVIRKIWEWLKPGGVFYVQVPNVDAVEAHVFRSYWYGLELPRHLYHYSPTALRRLFAFSGFEEGLLRTQADCYVEKSIRYLVDDLGGKLGMYRTPLAAVAKPPGVPWRVFRKAFRLGILWPFRRLTAAAGHGAAIEAVFVKNTSTEIYKSSRDFGQSDPNRVGQSDL